MDAAKKEAAPVVPIVGRSLVRKLAEVMGEVGYIPKHGENKFHGYKYAAEADIVSAVRGAMAKRALMIFPDVEKTEWRKMPGKNGEKTVCSLTVNFTIEDGESGEVRSFRVMGEGEDALDKASYKALTGAEKYAILKLFLIPTGDDPEKDDEAPPPKRAPAQQSAKQARPTHEDARKMAGAITTGDMAKVPPAPVAPSWRDVAKKLGDAGKTGEGAAAFIRQVTGKAKREELTPADLLKIIDAAEHAAQEKRRPIIDVPPGMSEEEAESLVRAQP